MSLRMMLIAVTWIVVTVALVGITYRLPEAKPKDVRLFWYMLFVIGYCCWAGVQVYATHKERKERNQPAAPAMKWVETGRVPIPDGKIGTNTFKDCWISEGSWQPTAPSPSQETEL